MMTSMLVSFPYSPQSTEKITFDEVENETTTTPAAERKRAPVRKKRGADDGAESKASKAKKVGKASTVSNTSIARKSAAAAGSSSEKTSDETSKKAHYPVIAFDTNRISTFMSKGKKSHAEILDKIVVDVCQAEKQGLEKFFKENPGGKSRADLLRVMVAVLDELPGELTSECPVDVEFEPEFVGGERDEVGVLSHVLATLREQSDMLSRYESDVKLLGEDHDLWLSGPSEEANQSIGEVAANTKEKAAVDVTGVTTEYSKVLDDISNYCDSVLADSKNANKAEAKAKTLQDSIYKGYQQVRFEAKGGVSLPEASTKDLVKNLQKK